MASNTLRRLRKTNLSSIYVNLITSKELADYEKIQLLEIAILLLNVDDEYLIELGHRIILLYAIEYNDWVPVYDVALNLGHIPVVKYVEFKLKNRYDNYGSFIREFQSSFQESFREGTKYLTEEQVRIKNRFEESLITDSQVIIAPTSYGKTELILSALNNVHNILVIVPTKALLTQTKSRILNSIDFNRKKKIVTHHEMFHKNDQNIVAILTQERVIKILQMNPSLKFPLVFVDEAHNILEDSVRSRLLATAIIFLHERTKEVRFKYFTPFLTDHTLLETSFVTTSLSELRVHETVKTETYYYTDLRQGYGRLYIYDQFLNKSYIANNTSFTSDINFVLDNSLSKNIIYINRPYDVDLFSKRLIKTLPDINSDIVEKAISDISEYLHSEYFLLKCLRKGVVFHHGSVPDNIKLYIEFLYTTVKELKYVVTTSTLLEGINIPANRLFLLSEKKGIKHLSPSQFKNLVGRICRFNEIFSGKFGNLEMLNPKIFIVASDYFTKNTNIINFLKKNTKVDKKKIDKSENILLKKTKVTPQKSEDLKRHKEIIENLQPGITDLTASIQAKTEFGKRCFENNVIEFDILENEVSGQSLINTHQKCQRLIDNSEDLIEFTYKIFWGFIEEGEKNRNILRLKELGARNFYKMILDWKINNASYNQMINSLTQYWQEYEDLGEFFIYVGKWGDKGVNGDKIIKSWIDLREKTFSDKVNLAIVKIKEEQDFFENKIFKFIEILNCFGLIENNYFLTAKYGTSNQAKIAMIKNGFSSTLSKLLLSKYIKFVEVDLSKEMVRLLPKLVSEMVSNNENEVIIHEARLNTYSGDEFRDPF